MAMEVVPLCIWYLDTSLKSQVLSLWLRLWKWKKKRKAFWMDGCWPAALCCSTPCRLSNRYHPHLQRQKINLIKAEPSWKPLQKNSARWRHWFSLCAAVRAVHKHRRPRCVMSEICFELNYSDMLFPLSSEPLVHVNIKISPTLPRWSWHAHAVPYTF